MTCPRRILITGSREWCHRQRAADGLLYALGEVYTRPELSDDYFDFAAVTIVHGAGLGLAPPEIPGLDYLAAQLAEQWGMRIEPHRANWTRYGRHAGPIRNAEMVTAGADICVGYPLGASPGTRGCMALAERAGIRVINFGDVELPLAS